MSSPFTAVEGRNILSLWVSLTSCQYGGECPSHKASRALFSSKFGPGVRLTKLGDTRSVEYELRKEGYSVQAVERGIDSCDEVQKLAHPRANEQQ
jgi:hypothetical protein